MNPRRRSPVPIILPCVVFLAFAIIPVYGDVSIPTNTNVYFEQNGSAYNGSVQFAVNCYGYRVYPGTTSAVPDNSTANSPEIVFSYAASCPGYGCVIYEPYYLNYRHIDRCDLSGVADNRSFSIPGFSDTPLPNCTSIRPFGMSRGNDEYYNTTPEYDSCMNETYEESDRCDQYLAECNPAKDTDCGNWIINGRTVKDTQNSRSCRDAADKNRTACDTYLKKVDPSSMVMYRDNRTRQMMPAERICEQHFTIPEPGAGNGTLTAQGPDSPHKSPVESLYCNILSLFGARC